MPEVAGVTGEPWLPLKTPSVDIDRAAREGIHGWRTRTHLSMPSAWPTPGRLQRLIRVRPLLWPTSLGAMWRRRLVQVGGHAPCQRMIHNRRKLTPVEVLQRVNVDAHQIGISELETGHDFLRSVIPNSEE
jgi:hypothetical protein